MSQNSYRGDPLSAGVRRARRVVGGLTLAVSYEGRGDVDPAPMLQAVRARMSSSMLKNFFSSASMAK